MLKTILRRMRQPALHCSTSDFAHDSWSCDPLSHPQLRGMSQRELADLPIDPRRIQRQC